MRHGLTGGVSLEVCENHLHQTTALTQQAPAEAMVKADAPCPGLSYVWMFTTISLIEPGLLGLKGLRLSA